MNEIAQNLKRYYDAFLEQPNRRDFFIGLKSYVDYILEEPVLKKIADEVMKKKVLEYKKLESLKKEPLRHLKQVRLLDSSTGVEIWNSFDYLFTFHKAFIYASQGTDFVMVAEKQMNKEYPESIEAAKIVHMLHELELVIGKEDSPPSSNNSSYLKLPILKHHTTRVHTHLLKEISKMSESEEMSESSAIKGLKQKMIFNAQTGVIRSGESLHKFQRGAKGEKERILMFKKLWDKKRYVRRNIEKIKGEAFTPEFLAVQLNLTKDAFGYSRNEKARNKLSGMIKGVNRILSDKEFPAHIEKKGGIQLVVKEK